MKSTAASREPKRPEDLLLRAILPTRALRLVVALSTGVAREAARRHGAVGGVAAALGRAATAGLLLATITKDRERLTAELAGDGPLGSLMVDANAAGEVRVYVKNPGVPVAVPAGAHVPLGRAIGRHGHVRVARDLGLREIVSGQTPLVDGEMDTDIEHYLVASEQIPSVLACETFLGTDLDLARQRRHPAADAAGQRSPALAGPAAGQAARRCPGGARWRAIGGRRSAVALPCWPRCWAWTEDLLALDTRPLRFLCRLLEGARHRRPGAARRLPGLDELMADEDERPRCTCDFCRARHRHPEPATDAGPPASARASAPRAARARLPSGDG